MTFQSFVYYIQFLYFVFDIIVVGVVQLESQSQVSYMMAFQNHDYAKYLRKYLKHVYHRSLYSYGESRALLLTLSWKVQDFQYTEYLYKGLFGTIQSSHCSRQESQPDSYL